MTVAQVNVMQDICDLEKAINEKMGFTKYIVDWGIGFITLKDSRGAILGHLEGYREGEPLTHEETRIVLQSILALSEMGELNNQRR